MSFSHRGYDVNSPPHKIAKRNPAGENTVSKVADTNIREEGRGREGGGGQENSEEDANSSPSPSATAGKLTIKEMRAGDNRKI